MSDRSRFTHCMFPEIDDEYNTNYVAITKLIILFLPHFLKLSVSKIHANPRSASN